MLLFMGRMFPIIALAPFFGAKVLPHSVKVVLGLSIFVILMPQLLIVTHSPLSFNHSLIFLFFKEMFVGTVLGFIISLPFMLVQNSGILIDHQRGGASLMVNDPTIQNQSSPLGTLFNYVLIYLFFMIDGPFTVIEIVLESYNMLPPDKYLSSQFFNINSETYKKIIGILGNLMILSIQLAAPALIMILMTDFFLGIANRLAPQVQITFLGMPLKSLLALAIVCFGWIQFNEEVVLQTRKALYELSFFVKHMVPSTA
jgi:type III secretion protein T